MDLVLDVGELIAAGQIDQMGVARQLRWLVAVIKPGGRSSTAGIFPFGFAEQAVALVFLAAEPIAKRDGVVPGHINDGVIVGLRKARIAPGELGPATDAFAGLR